MIFWPQITGLVDGDILFPGKTLGNKYVNLTRSDFEKKYQKGLEHIREENLNKALSHFEKLVKTIPADQQRSLYAHTKEKSYVQLIDLTKKLDKPNLTDQYYVELVKFKPTHVGYMKEYAQFLYDSNKLEDALEYIDMAHDLAITELNITELKLRVLYKLGMFDDFKDLYNAFENAQYFSFTRGRLFLTGEEESISEKNTFWVEDIIADGQLHTYIVDLTTQDNFKNLPDTINKLRFDPGHNTRQFTLAKIEFADELNNIFYSLHHFADWEMAGVKHIVDNTFINMWPKTSMHSNSLKSTRPSKVHITVEHLQGLSDDIHDLYKNLP